MLWDIIRDFFVQFIFGGIDSSETIYYGIIGGNYAVSGASDDFILLGTSETLYHTDFIDYYGDPFVLSIGDWLSTTFTIITLILICVFFLKFTIWMFKQGANLFKW